MINVAAYCRVSTDSEDQNHSLLNQKEFFLHYISQHKDWTLVDIYADEGVTGTSTKKRSEFNRMIKEAENGNIDLILTKEISRFARNTVDTLNYTRKLKYINVGVIFITDNIDTRDNDGEFRLSIMASVAQEESRKTSERCKWGLKRKMEQGFVLGPKNMMGFTIENGIININEKEASIVKSIFEKYAYHNKSTSQIAYELNTDKIPSKNGGIWNKTSILKILKNEKYVGDLKQGKRITIDYLNQKRKINHDENSIIYIKNHHEPIIDRQTWEKVQYEFKKRLHINEKSSHYSNKYWCSNKIYCGICNSLYIPKHYNRNYGKYNIWICSLKDHYGKLKNNIDGISKGCNSKIINDLSLRYCIKFLIKTIQYNENNIINSLVTDIKYIKDLNSSKNQIQKLNILLNNIKLKQEKSIDMLLNNIISKSDYLSISKKYFKEKEYIKSNLKQLEDKNSLNNYFDKEFLKREIEKIINQDIDTEKLYYELIEKIIVYNNFIIIFITSFPFKVIISYTTHGKGTSYYTKIEKFELI